MVSLEAFRQAGMLNKRFVRRGSNGERLKGLLPLDADRKDID